MRRRLSPIAAAAAAAALAAGGARAADCALALALALDISSSVNALEYDIQKTGLEMALRDEEIRAAILSPPGSVWLTVYEWSGWQQQDLVVAWARMDDPADIDAVADRLRRHNRRYAEFSTALGFAVEYGMDLFSNLDAACDRTVIDVSGDGVNNDGFPPDAGILVQRMPRLTINGLVIKGAEPDPEAYYRDRLIRGPGAFLMVARNGFEDYPDMIRGKLLRELKPVLLLGEARNR